MASFGSAPSKQFVYQQLVTERQQCRACESLGLTNPSVCAGGAHDHTGHIGPWSQWQANLEADLMVVGQDWGGVDYFLANQGVDDDNNPTNNTLIELLSSIGIHISPLAHASGQGLLYFTNAALCLRPGGLTGDVKKKWFSNCGPRFLRRQIELVRPKVVVTLGRHAYQTVLRTFGLKPARLMREAVQRDPQTIANGTTLVPVFHCGKNGQRSRPVAEQKEDWKRVRVALQEAGSTLCKI